MGYILKHQIRIWIDDEVLGRDKTENLVLRQFRNYVDGFIECRYLWLMLMLTRRSQWQRRLLVIRWMR